jgi:hypothetical protein
MPVFQSVTCDNNSKFHEKGMLEIRRGGGLQFEYGVLMSFMAVVELAQRKF